MNQPDVPPVNPAEVVDGPLQTRHALGPLVRFVRMERPRAGRLYALAIALTAVGLLVLAAALQPAAVGMGTHRQLGLPRCGFELTTGLPCPTCGMTTAFALTVRGRCVEAVKVQSAGFIFALATVGVGLVAAGGALTGKRPALNWYRIKPDRLVFWIAAGVVAAWGIKIVQVLAAGET
jgi:hypothetical protein